MKTKEATLKEARSIDRSRAIIAEHEVVVRLDRLTRKAYVSSSWPSLSKKLEKKYGPPKRKTVAQGGGKATSANWELPLAAISFRRPRRATVQSPETFKEDRAA